MAYISEGINNKTEDKYFKTATWNCCVPKVHVAGRAELLDSSAGGTGWSCAGWDSGEAPWGTEQMVLGAAQALVRQWFFLQRAVLPMVSASEGFRLKWVLKIFAVIFILPVFMGDCSFVKEPIEKHSGGVGSAGKRRTRLWWWQQLLLEYWEWSFEEELAGEKQMSDLNSGLCCFSYP